MNTYTQVELNIIIYEHLLWLMGDRRGKRADLTNANLTRANLTNVNLTHADLTRANLTRANLTNSCLSNADLTGADLTGADLWNVTGNSVEIKSLLIPNTYSINYTATRLQIGCQNHSIQDWWEFDDKTIARMDGKIALKFWREYKDIIRMIIENSPAVINKSILNSQTNPYSHFKYNV